MSLISLKLTGKPALVAHLLRGRRTRARRGSRLSAVTKSRVAIFGGEPLEGPRFMWWNFVSSRKDRLEQAKDDWKHRRFPLIPGDSEARIPMPGE